jgi:hypothetical protein
MKINKYSLFSCCILWSTLCLNAQTVTTPSPYGTGETKNQTLGSVVGSVPKANASNMVNYNLDLETETYDLYVPDSYDGSEPYGLVAWIHSNSGGSIPNDYKPVMDEKKLIWVGGDNIGNDQGTSRRIGKQILSVARMKELFNIDTNRIYSMGNSGGARTAHVSAMMHPFTFEGTLARCGAAYIGQVTQAYETRDPDSHYEYWGSSYYKAPAGMTYKEYLKGFGQRYAMLTSYGDFR